MIGPLLATLLASATASRCFCGQLLPRVLRGRPRRYCGRKACATRYFRAWQADHKGLRVLALQRVVRVLSVPGMAWRRRLKLACGHVLDVPAHQAGPRRKACRLCPKDAAKP